MSRQAGVATHRRHKPSYVVVGPRCPFVDKTAICLTPPMHNGKRSGIPYRELDTGIHVGVGGCRKAPAGIREVWMVDADSDCANAESRILGRSVGRQCLDHSLEFVDDLE